MAQRNDQVFQLSLTELAFTVAFILLLLLGYLVFKEQSGRLAAEAALGSVQSAEKATEALKEAKDALTEAIRDNSKLDVEDVITKLIAADSIRDERDRLKKQLEDLDARLTALTELREQLEKAGKANREGFIRDEVETALVLHEQVRKMLAADAKQVEGSATAEVKGDKDGKASIANDNNSTAANDVKDPVTPSKLSQEKLIERVKQAIAASSELRDQMKRELGKDVRPGSEAQAVRELVSSAKSYQELSRVGANPELMKKENTDLRGQVAFLKNRLDARGGRDFPPCWADETGKVEFLFSIETRQDTIVVNPAWPPRRDTEARGLPGVVEVLATSHSHQNFVKSIQGIFNWSKKQDPECRHYVQLKSAIADAVQSDRARLMVENYFYKVEARR